MYLLHIVYGGYEDCEEVRTFDTFSDVEDYVSQLDSDLYGDIFGIIRFNCYECTNCVDLLKKMRKEKK